MKQQIAASLELAFSQYGFAEPNVDKLKTACNVSLRTLYKHYPSKEAMVVAALEYRHQRYLAFLDNGPNQNAQSSLEIIFQRLETWMSENAPHGCLSMNAIAAFPDNLIINKVVKEHKAEVRQFLALKSQRAELANSLFLLHEGIASAWPILGADAVKSALVSLSALMHTPQPTH
ncbi:TetR/AcrR family transcriptional regulator [Marinomonas pollencensis]|uniref:TetR family transcriptional regulator n=1 Tax=Marinomonas pollencensis TaxID=491954 RepID=A0A3E0DER0_9GAMM|nr:TetR/AcrR family transcriptional regulator [Marinomonas pollencensis]REG81189.1 TetR family transcriptional regulator [Marinomonas pollencensis]